MNDVMIKDITAVMYHLRTNSKEVIYNPLYYDMLFNRLMRHEELKVLYFKEFPEEEKLCLP